MSDVQQAGDLEVLAREFVRVDASLIAVVRKALAAGRGEGAEVWQERVLPSLEQTHREIEEAVADVVAGRAEALGHQAGVRVGLAKHLDQFTLLWTTPKWQAHIESAVDEVVDAASRILKREPS